MSNFLALEELEAADLNAAFDEVTALFVRKTADETVNNSASLQDDDHLVLAMEASTTYELRLRAIVNSGTTPDIKFAWTVPSGTTMTVHFFEGSTPGTAASVLQGPGTESTVPAFSTIAADQIVIIEGLVMTSSTAGNLQLRWAQNTATVANTVVKTNSYMILRKVA